MSKINDGGPAFPHSKYMKHDVSGAFDTYAHGGMSLLDYAAIHADMSGLTFDNLASMALFVGEPPPTSHDMGTIVSLSARACAKARYIYAEAMVAASEERSTNAPAR